MAEAGTQSELEQQLQAAREESELTLEQLHLVQEELEVYFLKAQDLEDQLKAAGVADTERDAAAKQVESMSKERDKLKAELDQQKGAAEKAGADAKEAIKQRDAVTKQVESLSKERDKLKAERDQQKGAAEKAGAEAKEAAKQRDAATKQVESLSKERDQQAAEAEQQSELLRTAQRMLDGQARYLEDLSLKEEQAERAVDQLRLLKQEIRYYIQHSRPSSSLNPDQIQRLIELVKNPAVPLG